MQALEEDGNGRVLVVDAGASMRCAVLGDNLAAMGVRHNWSVRFLAVLVIIDSGAY
jgi:regulator of ribonuclease activity A